MKRLLRSAYLHAERDFAALEAGLPAVRRHDPSLPAGYDALRGRADAALRAERFRPALEAVLRGRKVLEAMRALIDADARVQAAAAAVARLQERARVPRLRTLPCVAAPARLLALARDHMQRKRYGQAAYLADAALAEAAPLERREAAAPGRLAGVEARLAELCELCADARGLAGDAEWELLADGTLEAAWTLGRGGFVALAERVVDELAFSLAAPLRFHRELRRAGAARPDDAALLRGALARGTDADAWASATAALWHTRVESGLRRVEAQRARLDRARALLEPVAPAAAGRTPAAGRTT
jgi:hypothetical protein